MNAFKFHKCLLMFFSVWIVIALAACSSFTSSSNDAGTDFSEEFLSSGSIILSQQVDSVDQTTGADQSIASAEPGLDGTLRAPLIGYIPPLVGFLPAENEAWLEIDTQNKRLAVYRGKDVLRSFAAEGNIDLKPGQYALQHKQKKAAWYAPDAYFTKRGLPVPGAQERARYRKGALGPFVLYPTTKFPIHSAPLWSEEVGGLRIAKADMSAIYFLLPIGATVVVK